MSCTLDFKTHIKKIREEALEIGFSTNTLIKYECIWKNFIKWKNEDVFIYSSDDYASFLLEYYNFDVNSYSTKSNTWHLNLMRSQRILDDWDNYKQFMLKRALPANLYDNYPYNWNKILDDYLAYCKNICYTKDNINRERKSYLQKVFSFFYKNNLSNINNIKKQDLIAFINFSIEKTERVKSRYFSYLRGFLNYLFIEDILSEDLSIYVPKIKSIRRKKLPTYLKQNDVEDLLKNIPKTKKVDIRNYAIILFAARLGLRISDILNIKLKDIDWRNYKINVTQSKNNNLNVLPLSKELSWAIIDYIKNVRPKCDNEYLFIKMKYPFEKMEYFREFNKYFDKLSIEVKDENKKGIHNLRHSLATNMLNNDIPIDIIASTLGDSIQTTSSTYLKIDIKNLKKCGLEVD